MNSSAGQQQFYSHQFNLQSQNNNARSQKQMDGQMQMQGIQYIQPQYQQQQQYSQMHPTQQNAVQSKFNMMHYHVSPRLPQQMQQYQMQINNQNSNQIQPQIQIQMQPQFIQAQAASASRSTISVIDYASYNENMLANRRMSSQLETQINAKITQNIKKNHARHNSMEILQQPPREINICLQQQQQSIPINQQQQVLPNINDNKQQQHEEQQLPLQEQQKLSQQIETEKQSSENALLAIKLKEKDAELEQLRSDLLNVQYQAQAKKEIVQKEQQYQLQVQGDIKQDAQIELTDSQLQMEFNETLPFSRPTIPVSTMPKPQYEQQSNANSNTNLNDYIKHELQNKKSELNLLEFTTQNGGDDKNQNQNQKEKESSSKIQQLKEIIEMQEQEIILYRQKCNQFESALEITSSAYQELQQQMQCTKEENLNEAAQMFQKEQSLVKQVERLTVKNSELELIIKDLNNKAQAQAKKLSLLTRANSGSSLHDNGQNQNKKVNEENRKGQRCGHLKVMHNNNVNNNTSKQQLQQSMECNQCQYNTNKTQKKVTSTQDESIALNVLNQKNEWLQSQLSQFDVQLKEGLQAKTLCEELQVILGISQEKERINQSKLKLCLKEIDRLKNAINNNKPLAYNKLPLHNKQQ